MRHPARQLDLHQRGQDRRRRRLVGGPDRAARPPHRLEGQRLDAPSPARPAAHPNARFTAPAAQCPVDRPRVGGPRRRADLGHPLRRPPGHQRAAGDRGRDWEHGVFLGSIMSSEKTAAAAGTVGEVRFDPFAMLPFCGYNMGDYIAALAEIGEATTARSCPSCSGSTGSARARTARSCGPASARTAGCSSGSRAPRRHADAVETPIGRVPTLEGGDPADPRALRAVRRPAPRPAQRRGRRTRNKAHRRLIPFS
jgi:phosphoenolpyruvate carboxykinase (GTP)